MDTAPAHAELLAPLSIHHSAAMRQQRSGNSWVLTPYGHPGRKAAGAFARAYGVGSAWHLLILVSGK